MIRAGFKLELEDESDDSSKHCEFSATSIKTEKKYWVEAKARSVVGVLGKTEQNGTSRSDPTSQLSKHLKNALKKPAADERLIFVDVNTPCNSDVMPSWLDRAENKLKMKEANLTSGVSAYVFVTNFCFHYNLDQEKQWIAALPYGLGIPDFVKKESLRLSEIYKRKQKHIDAFNIIESFKDYVELPQTFDGSLPSDNLSDESQKIKIGEKYFFQDLGENGIVATVTEAMVNESEKTIILITDTGHMLSKPISDVELNDYLKHPDAFFGVIRRQGRKSNDLFDFYENIIDIHMSYSKESTLKHMKKWENYNQLKKLSKFEIVLEYCESIAMHLHRQQEGA